MWIKVSFFLSTLTLIVGLPVRDKPLPITQESIDGLKYLLKLRQMHLQEQLQQPQEFLFSYRIPTQEELAVPLDAEAVALQQMLPPPQVPNEPNYYAMKPRKGSKKYQPSQKQIHLRNPPLSPIVVEDEDPIRHDYPFEDVNYDLGEQFYLPEGPTHEEVATTEAAAAAQAEPAQHRELNTGETYSAIRRKTEPQEDRVEFQMHGHAGPKSYKFGYDTAKTGSSDSKKSTTREN
ncbi:uncharacterized protein LOC129793661 isoform X2 [Lutzomyia longipalpis]|uniref:uncharacterized protein LOC129793661 isoform X2 n=1 Tax=Lutzomyia longipalpis TaxID=7200 RepID=UPI0024836EA2|nr:uncharacterized protein LOC129793661 isoform X2 [Lutzomyia longipalpis]